MAELTFRDIGPADADAFHAMVSDWAIARQLGSWPWPPDRAFTDARCKGYDGSRGPGFVWAVCEDGRFVGSLGIVGGSIGYTFAAAVKGRGLATRAARVAIDHAFDTTPLAAITATTWHDNPASGRVLAKLGFAHWQTNYIHARARRIPTLSYSHRLTRADWQRLSNQPQ